MNLKEYVDLDVSY